MRYKIAVSALILSLCSACHETASIGIIGGADGPTKIFVSADNNKQSSVTELYDRKVQYIGDHIAVGELLAELPYLSHTDGMKLFTDSQPYEVGVYTYLKSVSDAEEADFYRAAALAISLIDNCDGMKFINRPTEEILCEITRAELDKKLPKSLSEYAESQSGFTELYDLVAKDRPADTIFLNDIIIDRNKGGYLSGECIGAGHIVLGTDTDGENTVYYLVTSYGEYGFENGRLVKVSGSGAIPVRITLDKSGNLADYKEPLDGSGYLPSLKEMFPKKYVNMVNSDEGKYYEHCRAQEEVYALRYLAQINRRDTEVGVDTEEYDKYYPLPDMAVEVSNTLLDRYYDYPYWIGTQERVEDGIRYVYEKKWENHGGGDGIVSYIKSRYDNGQICERTVIEIKNGEIQYLEGTPRPDRN